MPIVDDLIVSLRIEDTGNLGKLQKQLTALVGEKGEKAVQLGVGIDPFLKREILQIKGRLEYITHIAPGIDPKKLALSASALYKTLSDPQMAKNILGKLGQSELWLKDIQEILTGIATGTSEMKPTKIGALIPLLEKAVRQSPAAIGNIRQLVTDITEAVEEFVRQKQLQEIFKDFGDSVREYYIAMSKPPKEIKDILEKDEGLKAFVKAEKEGIGEEEFNKLVNNIKVLQDPLKVLSEFKDINILEFTKLPEKLKPLAAAYIEVMRTQQIQVIDLMREHFQKIKKGSTGLTQKLESTSLDFLMTMDVWKQVLGAFKGEGLEKLGGIDLPELAKYVGVELEKGTTAGYTREMRERLRKFAYTVMLFLKTNTNLDKNMDSLDRTAEETKNAFTAYLVDIAKIREKTGKAMTSEEMDEHFKEYQEKITGELIADPSIVDPIEKLKDMTLKLVEKQIKEDPENFREFYNQLYDIKEAIEDIGETQKDLMEAVGVKKITQDEIDRRNRGTQGKDQSVGIP